jgi:uncharacterized Fe-S cluster protein YjdI/CDGSH-type Zn-finger protein
MDKITKKYTNGEITVVWKPHLCVHATTCFVELPKVFIPYERPWVNMKGGTTEEIIDTVLKCPTDALTFYYNKDISKDEANDNDKDEVVIKVIKNGAFLVKGKFKLTDSDGNEIEVGKTTALCRCGLTKKNPICDGSHLNSNFHIDDGKDY